MRPRSTVVGEYVGRTRTKTLGWGTDDEAGTGDSDGLAEVLLDDTRAHALLLGPNATAAGEYVGCTRARFATIRDWSADDGSVSINSDRLAEEIVKQAIEARRNELCLEGPVATGLDEYINGAGVASSLVVLWYADDHRVAVDGD